MKLPSIMSPDGRRAWSFAALCGAGMVFTLFAAFAVWQLRNNPEWTGWLGIAAHAQVFMVLGALAWALGRRLVATFARDGVTVDDRENSDDV